MVSVEEEAKTRLVPLTQAEAVYARNRDPQDRPAWPQLDDLVYYRRDEWATELYQMRVVGVQDPADRDSVWATNLVQHLRATFGAPLYYPDGSPVLVPLDDPWPWVTLRWDGVLPKGSPTWMYRVQMTFEARLRGSPGWLPADYLTSRRVVLPGQVLFRAPTAWRYQAGVLQFEKGDGVWQPYR
jgi:hypothetical protein